jgi:hypothetical protein
MGPLKKSKQLHKKCRGGQKIAMWSEKRNVGLE